jgi:thiol-disulfide isomerase/thioredoxin
VYGQGYRFEKAKNENGVPDFSGKYSVDFIFEADTTPAIGIFKQVGDSVTGTFLTETGDYRYLQGNVSNGMLQLSTFDGNHAYIFTASKGQDGKIIGEFYSGKTHMEFWEGIRDDNAQLADPESLTFLKKGFEKIEFSFPDVNGKKIGLNDEKYKNKVVILQLFGTWCPNCMDETKFLVPWYKEHQQRGVEIIGLAYERKDDFNYASTRVKKMIEKFNVPYDFVIAGTNNKEKASETLPQLNKIVAFPTTIFIGKDGKVKKIHTGFAGPGTGIYYDQFVEHFNETVNELLGQNLALSSR